MPRTSWHGPPQARARFGDQETSRPGGLGKLLCWMAVLTSATTRETTVSERWQGLTGSQATGCCAVLLLRPFNFSRAVDWCASSTSSSSLSILREGACMCWAWNVPAGPHGVTSLSLSPVPPLGLLRAGWLRHEMSHTAAIAVPVWATRRACGQRELVHLLFVAPVE